jgi:hypothetical protein
MHAKTPHNHPTRRRTESAKPIAFHKTHEPIKGINRAAEIPLFDSITDTLAVGETQQRLSSIE